jgi:hypothetical protein
LGLFRNTREPEDGGCRSEKSEISYPTGRAIQYVARVFLVRGSVPTVRGGGGENKGVPAMSAQ